MSTAVATQPSKGMTIKDHLKSDAIKSEIAKALPAHCKPDRMIRVALTALTRTPALAECDQASFFQCLLSLSQWGLEPDGRRAHLIPFRNNRAGKVECQLIIDYKGLVELAYNSGVVKSIHADVVRDGDLFIYNMGQIEKHVPWFLRRDGDKPAKAGEVFAVYCYCELKDGASKTEVMASDEIEAIRKRSKAGGSGPWVTDWTEMAKKTVFRRLTKWLPLSAEVRDVMDVDDDRLEDIPQAAIKPVRTLDDLSSMFTNAETPAIEAKPEAVFDIGDFEAALTQCKTASDITKLAKTIPADVSEEVRKGLEHRMLEREQALGLLN